MSFVSSCRAEVDSLRMVDCGCFTFFSPQPWVRRVNEIFFKPVSGATADAAIVRLAEYAAGKPNHLPLVAREIALRCTSELRKSAVRVNVIAVAARAYVALLETISTLGGGSYGGGASASAVGKVGALGIFEQHITSLLLVLLSHQNAEIVEIGASLARSFLTALATSAAGHDISSFSSVDQSRLDLLLTPLIEVAGALPGSPGASVAASISSLGALRQLLSASDSQTLDSHLRSITQLTLKVLYREHENGNINITSSSNEVLNSADDLLRIVSSYLNAATSSSVFDPAFAFLDERFWQPSSFAIKICSTFDAHVNRESWGLRQSSIIAERSSSSSSSASSSGTGSAGVGPVFSFTSPFRIHRSVQNSSFSTPGYLLLLRHISAIDAAFFGIPAAAFLDATRDEMKPRRSQTSGKTSSVSSSARAKPLNELWWLHSTGMGSGTYNESDHDILPRLEDFERAEKEFEKLRLGILLVSDALISNSRADVSIGPFVKETLDHLFPILVEDSDADFGAISRSDSDAVKCRRTRQQQFMAFSLLDRVLSRLNASTDLLRFTSHALEMFGDHVAEFIAFHGPLRKGLLTLLDLGGSLEGGGGGVTERDRGQHSRGISTVSSILASSSTLPNSRTASMSLRRIHSTSSSIASVSTTTPSKRRNSGKPPSGLSIGVDGNVSPTTTVGDIELTIRTDFSIPVNMNESVEMRNEDDGEVETSNESVYHHVTMARLRLLLLVYRSIRRLRFILSGGLSPATPVTAIVPARTLARASNTSIAPSSSAASKQFFFRADVDTPTSSQPPTVLEAPVEVLRGLELALSDPDSRVRRLAGCSLHEFLCCDGPVLSTSPAIDGDIEWVQWTENDVFQATEQAYAETQEVNEKKLPNTALDMNHFRNPDSGTSPMISKLTLRNESASRLFSALAYAAHDACNSASLDSMPAVAELALLVRLTRDLVRIGGVASIFRFTLPLAYSSSKLSGAKGEKFLLEKLFREGVLSVVAEAVGAKRPPPSHPSLASVKEGWITKSTSSNAPESNTTSLINDYDDIESAAVAILSSEGMWKAITMIGIPLPTLPQIDSDAIRLRLVRSAQTDLQSVRTSLSSNFSEVTASAAVPLPPVQNETSWSSYCLAGLRHQNSKNHISSLQSSIMSLDSAWRRAQLTSSSSNANNISDDLSAISAKDAASDFYRFLFVGVNTNSQDGKDGGIISKHSSLPPRAPSSIAVAPAQTAQTVHNHESRLLSLLLGLLTIDWQLGSKWMQQRCEGLIDIWPLAASSTAVVAANSGGSRSPEASTGRFTARVTLSSKASSLKSSYDALRITDGSAASNAPATPSSPFLFNLFSNNTIGSTASDFLSAARSSPSASSPVSKTSISQQVPLTKANNINQTSHGNPLFRTVTRSSSGNSLEFGRGGGESQLLQWRPASANGGGAGGRRNEEEGDTASSISIKTAPDVSDCLDLLQDLTVASIAHQTKIKKMEGEKGKKKRSVGLLEMGADLIE